jgi:hypothetical protein
VAAYVLSAVALALVVNTVVTNCQGRDAGAGQTPAGASGRPPANPAAPPGAVPNGGQSAAPHAAAPGGRQQPQAGSPAQLRLLVGRWLSTAKAKDYFVFTTTGRGAWMVRGGRVLWKGRATPAGQYAFRLSWQTSADYTAAYWQVKLIDGGRRMVFSGTRQVYRKV